MQRISRICHQIEHVSFQRLQEIYTNVSPDRLVTVSEWSSTEVCALVICSSVPSFHAFAGSFPCLSKFLSQRTTKITDNQQHTYRLRSLNTRSESIRFSGNKTNTATVGTVHSESQEEIFSANGNAGHDGILEEIWEPPALINRSD